MQNQKKKLLLWDNDGVLVDTEQLYFQASQQALAEIGVDLSLSTFIELSLRRGLSVLELPETAHLNEQQLANLRNRRNELYACRLNNGAPVCTGIHETLAELHGRVQMAIVTSCRRDHFGLIHQNTGLLNYFDFILVREDYRNSKPAPEPYLTALDRAGAAADEALVVEDSPRGVAAAKAAGIDVIAISHPMNNGADLSHADWHINHPSEIIPLLSND